MSSSTTKLYDTPLELDYNSSLIEVLASAKLEQTVYPGETAYAGYTDTLDLVRSAGSATAVNGGAAAVVLDSGKASIPTGSFLQYNDTLNFLLGNTFAIEFDFTASWTGFPGGDVILLGAADTVSTANNEFRLFMQSNGTIRLFLFDSTGGTIVNNFVLNNLSAVSGTSYHMSFNVDTTTGEINLFIDGVIGATSTLTGTRTDDVAVLNIGASRSSATSTEDFKVDNFRVFSDVQHTANYTPVANYYDFDQTSPTIIHVAGIGVSAISSLAIDDTTPANTSISYYVEFNGGTKYWWDGAAWAVSDGSLAKSNTKADLIANITTFDASAGKEFWIAAKLTSDDGFTTPELISFTLGYTFFNISEDLNKCLVHFEIYDSSGNPLEGAEVTFDIEDFWYGEGLISASVSTKSDAEGKGEIEVVETATHGKTANILITHKSIPPLRYSDKIIPNKSIEALSVIVS